MNTLNQGQPPLSGLDILEHIAGAANAVSPRKKKKLPDITPYLETLERKLGAKYFPLTKIPEAVNWAEMGNISIHENFASRRKQAYHVISGSKQKLEDFCRELGLSPAQIKASEFYKFWHLTWFPNQSEGGGERTASG